ncbi:hypothetical protein BAUCODRAFT_263214 [Baudoinia panamericana UAMH 10762]|uniref:Uncharacterized protein n=1 Tax=Baudoinia panamericana (strain UAMH 10762) TaxID=717646 RepID=M2N1J0_BAUPA|nr:uncharacterized protein BAUCODRAFT_263214 [Baudoinia panamericana UAMH 10762]EMC92819.1 hypothetical protein BAUCODRAFT_263214 [Baudoinia panamericana UAMH 10762]
MLCRYGHQIRGACFGQAMVLFRTSATFLRLVTPVLDRFHASSRSKPVIRPSSCNENIFKG